jgi:AAA+ superfamily predicted ATPase
VLDECHLLAINRLDEWLLSPLENANITWIAMTASPGQLDPMFVRRFSLRESTSLPSKQELANFLADRCREFQLGVDDASTLGLLAKLSHQRPSECVRVLSQAALEQDRKLKRDMVTKFDFLPKQGPTSTPLPTTSIIVAGV